MAATIDRNTGAVISAPVLTAEQKDRMADAIAQAMVQLSRPLIAEAVNEYMRRKNDVA